MRHAGAPFQIQMTNLEAHLYNTPSTHCRSENHVRSANYRSLSHQLNMRALILDAEARTANLSNVPDPRPAANEILVKVESISMNPIDPLYVAHPLGSTGRTVGSDFAGRVVEVGPGVPVSSRLHEGDRVAGFLQGACSVNPRPGAFAEYVTIPWDLVWRVPASVSLEEAAGVSLVALTAAQGMWYRIGLTAPFPYDREAVLRENPNWQQSHIGSASQPETINVFVYSASTSVGLYAAQMARLGAKAGGKRIRLFGAASIARWDFLRAEPYCYDHLVDYRDKNWPHQIKVLSGGMGIHYAYDGLSEGDSVARVASTLACTGKMAIVRSREGGAWKANDLQIEPIYGAVWEGLGEEVHYQGLVVGKSSAARTFSVAFYQWLSVALGTELKPVPIRLMPGGLENVVGDGFALLGAGGMEDRQVLRTEDWMRPVSAEKLVYNLQ
jgi:NADPH:quinone reductase-like Zn-dependent oxidoreductase